MSHLWKILRKGRPLHIDNFKNELKQLTHGHNWIAQENVTSVHNNQKAKTVSTCVRDESNTKHIKMSLYKLMKLKLWKFCSAWLLNLQMVKAEIEEAPKKVNGSHYSMDKFSYEQKFKKWQLFRSKTRRKRSDPTEL